MIKKCKRHGTRNKERWWVGTDNLVSTTGLLWTTWWAVTLGSLTCEEGGNSQHGTSVLLTSHPKDGLVVNLCIPHNRRTPLQAEEALGPISIPRVPAGLTPFRGLVPLGRRNLVPILPPAHPLGGGWGRAIEWVKSIKKMWYSLFSRNVFRS